MLDRSFKKKVTYTLPKDTIEMVKEESIRRNLNMSVLVQLALEEYFRKEERSDK